MQIIVLTDQILLEVQLLLKARDTTFRTGSAGAYSSSRANLQKGIKKAKHSHKAKDRGVLQEQLWPPSTCGKASWSSQATNLTYTSTPSSNARACERSGARSEQGERVLIQRPERWFRFAQVPLRYRSPQACTSPHRLTCAFKEVIRWEMEFVKYFEKQADRSYRCNVRNCSLF